MMMLAIPFVFGSLRSISLGSRLLMGLGVGFSFYLLNQFFVPLSTVFQLSPLFAAMLPTVLFALLGYVLMRRAG